jgi:uncharacterized Zn finger protein (UPF0148 family)
MMAETLTQTAVCESCGAEVRDGSLFCYNCGEKVRAEERVSESVPTDDVAVVDEPISESAASDDVAVSDARSKRPPLRSAASLRKQRRAYNRQPVEIRWEQRERAPLSFVIASVILTVGALALLILALYLR